MDASVYNAQEWRKLPREYCIVALLFGSKAGPCADRIDRHHVDPPADITVQVCARHHPKLEAARRHLLEESDSAKGWRPCPHPPGTHRYPGAREACEARLNRELTAA